MFSKFRVAAAMVAALLVYGLDRAITCTTPPCVATTSVYCTVESTSVPFSLAPQVVTLTLDVHNTTVGCFNPPGPDIDVSTLQVTETDTFLDSPAALVGFPATPFLIPGSSSQGGTISVSIPGGAPVGLRTYNVTVAGVIGPVGMVSHRCTARVRIVGPIALEETMGDCAYPAGTIGQKVFRIRNNTAVARTVDWTVTSQQKTSSTTNDHYPISLCSDPLPAGDPNSTTIPTLTGTVSLPAGVGQFVEVCIATRSYAGCHSCSSNGYTMNAVDMATSAIAEAESHYTVLPLGWGGNVPIKSGCDGNVDFYCQSQQNSLGCVPLLQTQGVPDAGNAAPFRVIAPDVVPNQAGVLIYSTQGPAMLPFGGGFLCVQPPVVRTPPQFSGVSGPPPCPGVFQFDFNAWIASGMDPALQVGGQAFLQYWSRDPLAPAGTNLTNAVRIVICP